MQAGLMIAVVATGAGMVGPVLSYGLLERKADAAGALLGRQAAAGNLGQALGSMGAGSLFTFAPMAPFWTAAAVLLLGAVLSLVWWGPTRVRDIAAGYRANGGNGESTASKAAEKLPAPA